MTEVFQEFLKEVAPPNNTLGGERVQLGMVDKGATYPGRVHSVPYVAGMARNPSAGPGTKTAGMQLGTVGFWLSHMPEGKHNWNALWQLGWTERESASRMEWNPYEFDWPCFGELDIAEGLGYNGFAKASSTTGQVNNNKISVHSFGLCGGGDFNDNRCQGNFKNPTSSWRENGQGGITVAELTTVNANYSAPATETSGGGLSLTWMKDFNTECHLNGCAYMSRMDEEFLTIAFFGPTKTAKVNDIFNSDDEPSRDDLTQLSDAYMQMPTAQIGARVGTICPTRSNNPAQECACNQYGFSNLRWKIDYTCGVPWDPPDSQHGLACGISETGAKLDIATQYWEFIAIKEWDSSIPPPPAPPINYVHSPPSAPLPPSPPVLLPTFEPSTCFPSWARVTRADGTTARIEELEEGDAIVAATADGRITVDTVSLLSLADAGAQGTFVSFATDKRHTLTLTPEHHLPVGDVCCSELKQAKDVAVGESVWATGGANGADLGRQKVVSKTLAIERGLFSPVLTHGTFPIVDGVVTSSDARNKMRIAEYLLPYVQPLCKATGTCSLIRRTFFGADRTYIDGLEIRAEALKASPSMSAVFGMQSLFLSPL